MKADQQRKSASQDHTLEDEVKVSRLDIADREVKRVMDVEGKILGDQKQKFLFKYIGDLRIEPEQAYDQLANALRPYQITPLSRIEDSKHNIILIEGVIEPKPSNPLVNLVMFILTIFSMLFVGLLYSGYSGPHNTTALNLIGDILLNLWRGWPFAVSLLAILLAHEFGHYLAARYHKSAVTLPYFIPFPFSPLSFHVQLFLLFFNAADVLDHDFFILPMGLHHHQFIIHVGQFGI